MKMIMLLMVGFFLSPTLIAQSNYQQEVICPCMLEYKFPKTIEDGQGLLQAFGGVPVVRFAKARIEGGKLICQYETAFAKYFFDGFGYTKSSDQLEDVPNKLTLTLVEDLLHGWTPTRKTVKLPQYHRGCVVYTIDRCLGDGMYSWNGAFFKSEYTGKRITMYRKFDNEARINSTGTGFILSDTKTGLYTPAANTGEISNPAIKEKRKRRTKRIIK
ncbi:MAG: hypothetical protein U9N86_16185 [Bacteroidota bacterium]|nr:hypothetical protein [Bacteroidota bacterium]